MHRHDATCTLSILHQWAVNALSNVKGHFPGFWTIAGHLNADINPDTEVTFRVALQDFVADVKGIGTPLRLGG